jgi:hypothetical protein
MEFRGPLASDYFSSSSSDRVNNYSNKDYTIVNIDSSSHVPGINPLNSSSLASSIVLSPATTTATTATLIGGAPVLEPMHRNIGGRSPKMGPSSGGLSLPIGSSEYGSSGLAKFKSSSSDLYSKQQQYLSRATSLDQMDLQAALDQMRIILSLAPYRVYKTSYYRKQTKNHWSRDDPAFCVLEVLFLLVASVSYNIAFRQQSMFLSTIIFALQHIFGIFFGCGAIVATLGQYVSNNYLSHLPNNSNGGTAGGGSSTSGSTHHVQQKVEWMYAFDIHCNAFLPFFVVLCKCMRCLFRTVKKIFETFAGSKVPLDLYAYQLFSALFFTHL